MKRKMITMLLAIGLVLSQTTNFAFAETQAPIGDNIIGGPTEIIDQIGDFEIQSISNYSLSFSKSSSTKATGSLKVVSLTTPSSIKATIRLQVASKSSTSYQNASADSVTATVNNKDILTKSFSFPITTTKKYRVKATVVETVNGKKNTYTYYKTLS